MSVHTVELEGAVRRFGAKTAVDGVTFAVDSGEVFGLLGHNGAGKTTLIRMINGLLPADEGRVVTLGMDPVRDGSSVRQRVGVLTEYPALEDFLTPAENLGVYAAIHGVDAQRATVRSTRLIERLGLAEHALLPARSLSAGLKQRLALARALMHEPELLLLDEPTSNLDPLAARGVRELVHELSREQGRTVILSTHNLIEAQELCDRVAIIQHGHLLAAGTLQELGRRIDHGVVHFSFDPRDLDGAEAVVRSWAGSEAPVRLRHDTLVVRMAQGDVPACVAGLVQADLRITGVIPQLPTLEDVYVSLHDRPSGVPAQSGTP